MMWSGVSGPIASCAAELPSVFKERVATIVER